MSIAIILAAGEGTRMKSRKAKVLHEICGKPMLSYVVEASKNAGVKKNLVIVGHGAEEIKEEFKESDIYFAEQPIGEDAPYGTGYAVMQGVDHIEDDMDVVILCGDAPLIKEETIKNMLDNHRKENYDGTVLTAILEDSTGYGRIVRDKSGHIKGIVEEKDASSEERDIKEINSGVFCFNGKLLKEALKEIDDDNAQGEFYITDVIEILNNKGYKIGAYTTDDSQEIHGINSRKQLAFCERVMRERINNLHMENGVTLIDPENTYIESGVTIGTDTIIYPGVNLQGDTKIGKDCILRTGTRIIDSKIDDNVVVESSLIEESTVGSGTNVGPSAHLRPQSRLGKDINIGNFVEVKNAEIGDGTKAGHLAYIGDAVVGKNVNIGCGVIFVNYDGKNKFMTHVGNDAFIGSNSNLVAPVYIADKGYIAAGSTITEDVKEGDLSIARARQINIEDWLKNK